MGKTRAALLAFGGLFVFSMLAARADDRDAALEIVNRAIKAHGGEDRMAKTLIVTRSGKGKQYLFDKEIPFSTETIMHLPDRFRHNNEMSVGDGQKVASVVVIDGTKGWQQTGGASQELHKTLLDEHQEVGYIYWLATLLPMKDKSVTLKVVPEIKVDDQPAAGVQASSKGRPDVKFYFDKKTDLLVKLEYRGKESGQAVTKEFLYGDFKEFEGVKVATRYVEMINGKKWFELTFDKYSFPSKLENKAFAKP